MAQLLPSETPYEGCTVYGPIWHSSQKRRMVVIKRTTGKLTSTSYARYILAVRIGRELIRGEEADHIDNNKQNDTLENLQVLSAEDNKKKYDAIRPPITNYIFNCAECGKEKSVISRNATCLKKNGYAFCCQSCSARFHARKRSKTVVHLS